MEQQNTNPNPNPKKTKNGVHDHEQLECPRCGSKNTKFSYYNNHSLLQPRHYCKTCRRYWTKGGTLRNVPVGGSSRGPNNKKIVRNASTSAATSVIDLTKENSGQCEMSLVPVEGYFGNLNFPESRNAGDNGDLLNMLFGGWR